MYPILLPMITRTISGKLSALLSATLAVTTLVTATFAIYHVRQEATSAFVESSRGQMLQLDRNLQTVFGQVSANAAYLASLPVLQSADASITAYQNGGGTMNTASMTD